MKLFGLFAFIFVFAKCTPDTTQPVPEHLFGIENLMVVPDNETGNLLRLTEKTVYKTQSDSLIIGFIPGQTVDPQGNLFVIDGPKRAVHQFSASGEYKRSYGREGRGPCEFMSIASIKVRENQLYIFDGNLLKIASVNIETGNCEGEQAVKPEPGHTVKDPIQNPYRFFPISDDRLLVFYSSGFIPETVGQTRYIRAHIWEWNTGIVSADVFELEHPYKPVYTPEGGFLLLNFPFLQNLLVTSNGSNIYIGATDEILVRTFSMAGEYQKAVYQKTDPVPFDKEQYIANTEENGGSYGKQIAGVLRKLDIPDTERSVNHLVPVSNGDFWIGLKQPDNSNIQWRLYDASGTITGHLELPPASYIFHAETGLVYIRTQADEPLFSPKT